MNASGISYEAVLRALCRSVTMNQAIRVKGKQGGYRCKATYSLLPKLRVSPLSMSRVNEIAAAVDDFCRSQSSIPQFAPNFFFEVCVKVSRTGQYMVKLALLNRGLSQEAVENGEVLSGAEASVLDGIAVASALCIPAAASTPVGTSETLFDVWRRSPEPLALEDYLRARFPGLVALIAHVRLSSSDAVQREVLYRKPDKSSAYVPCTRDGATAMLEYTPNGHSFWLSADSFCEVNHEMEDAVYEAIVHFLRLAPKDADEVCGSAPLSNEFLTEAVSTYPGSASNRISSAATNAESRSAALPSSPSPHPRRRAFICGRDVNSVVRTFEGIYDATTVVTSCPCVYADTQRNGIAHCLQCAKDQICHALHRFALPATQDEAVGPLKDVVTSTEKKEELHVLITAGRHGLHPSTATALTQLGASAHLSDLVYVSCNIDSLTRDVHILKEAWYVAAARTFDFFPGTDYVMTVLHLRPLAACTAGTQTSAGVRRGDLLVLPVGLPGTGKSSGGRALADFFRSVTNTEDTAAVQQPRSRKAARREEGSGTTAAAAAATCSVPRSLLVLQEQAVYFRHVERDQLFHEARSSASLKVAKQRTHEALVASLGAWERAETAHSGTPFRRVLYLDSTNGSREARDLYVSLWNTSSQGCRRGDVDGVPLPASCLTLFFDSPTSTNVLLRRVQQRVAHPSFPADPSEQQRKLDVLAAALLENGERCGFIAPSRDACEPSDAGCDVAASSIACRRIRASAEENSAAATVQEVVVMVCAHLLFSRELAALLLDEALRALREGW